MSFMEASAVISKVEIYRVRIPLKEPFVISLGPIHNAENIIVIIRTKDGCTGYGECSPYMTINGESADTCFIVGQYFAKVLKGRLAFDIEANMQAMDKLIYGNSSIKSAFDMALYDIAAQHAGVPLYEFLGGKKNKVLETDMTVSIGTPEKMKQVIRLLLRHKEAAIFLFGGKSDAVIFEQWENEFERVESLAGKMTFENELEYIAALDVMVSMDSANMHLASLYNVPVVSIWGATHPYAGFYGWTQLPGNAVQIDLYCRPCSVFGNKPGYRGDLLCLHSIAPLTIYNKVMENISLTGSAV